MGKRHLWEWEFDKACQNCQAVSSAESLSFPRPYHRRGTTPWAMPTPWGQVLNSPETLLRCEQAHTWIHHNSFKCWMNKTVSSVHSISRHRGKRYQLTSLPVPVPLHSVTRQKWLNCQMNQASCSHPSGDKNLSMDSFSLRLLFDFLSAAVQKPTGIKVSCIMGADTP